MIIVKETVERYVLSETMAVIGRRVRAARKQKGWTLQEAGPQLGLSVAFLCDLENGKTRISADRLLGVAKGLGVTIGQLCKGL